MSRRERSENSNGLSQPYDGSLSSPSTFNATDSSSGAATSGPANDDSQSPYYKSSAPSLNSPKGGGALRSIDEKFQVNSATGTTSLAVPIGTTPGRNSIAPALSLSYDSGSGNSSFGLGWSLSLPSVTRRTSKGIPRYEIGELDQDGEDVFLFSGVEDLVPKLELSADNSKTYAFVESLSADCNFKIRQYIPRTEGSFIRIERWSHKTDLSSIHWRTISQSNVTSIYGISTNSRICDPRDARRIFSWMLAFTYDGKGSAMMCTYKPDDDEGIDVNLTSERHRSDGARTTNRYVKSIVYGNTAPNIDSAGTVILPEIDPHDGILVLKGNDWMFEVVFDYGDHAGNAPVSSPNGQWRARPDSFSSYNSGFEIRTTRLCSRVLMFHHLKEELGVDDYLVSSTDLSYDKSPVASYLSQVTQVGYVLDPSHIPHLGGGATYLVKATPPVVFEYSKLELADGKGDFQIKTCNNESLENLPEGLNNGYEWIDLDGEGRPSVIYASQGGWYRKENLSTFSSHSVPPSSSNSSTRSRSSSNTSLSTSTDFRLGTAELITQVPNSSKQTTVNFLDLNGNGSTDLMIAPSSGSNETIMGPGFWQRTDDGGWTEFTTFSTFPCGIDFTDPNLRYLDLTGDGRADVIISEGGDSFLWYPGLGTAGYGEAVRAYTNLDTSDGTITDDVSPGVPLTGVNTVNEMGAPRVVFSNDREAVYLADFTGDGLSDLVRIMNGDISYWPNIGYGRFGSKITMANSPWMDTLDGFTYSRLRLGDIDGSGCADLLYFPPSGGLKIWINEAGNSFPITPYELAFPQIDHLSSLSVLDLFGSGTSSVVWSSSSPGLAEGMRLQYAEFNKGTKPHLLKAYKKGPLEARLKYTPSSQFYQDDKLRGAAWATKLPFPVQCLSSVETFDFISGNYTTCRYKYHHGFYDGIEREFRGFGFVESEETEFFLGTPPGLGSFSFPDRRERLDGVLFTHPVLSKKWYYTGAFFEQENIRQAFGAEYYQNETMKALGAPISLRIPAMEGSMTPEESRQAWRTLKGSCLREETYQSDGSPNAALPFLIKDNSYGVVPLQPSSIKNPISRPGVFHVTVRESLSFRLERNVADLRVSHKMILEIDSFGNETKSVSINYGRSKSEMTTVFSADDVIIQTTNILLYTEQSFTNAIDTPNVHLVPQPAGTTTFQIHGVAPSNANGFFTPSDFGMQTARDSFKFRALPLKDYADDTSTQGLRLLSRKQTRYRSDDLSQFLSFRAIESLAIPAQSYTLAITPDIFSSCYQSNQDSPLLQDTTILSQKGSGDGGYLNLSSDQSFWIPSGTHQFISTPSTIVAADIPTTRGVTTAAAELAAARLSFFTPVSFTDPFGKSQTVTFDKKFLVPITTVDAVGNTTTAKYDYSNMQPVLITDANGNQDASAYDELGSCIYHASLGNPSIKPTGDTVDGVNPFRSSEEIQALLADPVSKAAEFLGKGQAVCFPTFQLKIRSMGPGRLHFKSLFRGIRISLI